MEAGNQIYEIYIEGESILKDPSDATYNYYLIKQWRYNITKTGTKEVPSDSTRGTVFSDKRNAYPDNGKSGKYWYVYSDIQ